MKKVKLSLQQLTILDKVQKTQLVIKSMTGNANFPTPTPKLVDLGAAAQTLNDSFGAAEEARELSIKATAQMELDEEALDDLLTTEASYVETASGGDEIKILSAGMDVRSKPQPVGIPARVLNLAATEGAADGSIALTWKGVKGAKSYVVRVTTDIMDNSKWQVSTVVTKTAATISGLASGTKYWWQVAAVGAAGQGPWSDPAVKVAP